MAEQFKNFSSTQLDGGIDDSVTTVTVDSAMGFTTGDFRMRIDDEIMIVTAVSGLDFTVTRHAEGTSAASHGDNAPVYHILTVGALDAHDQNDLAVRDAYASRPAAGVPGRIFLPTDGVFLEYDDGSTWTKFGPVWPMTPPQVSDFPTWVNQGGSTAEDNKGAIFLRCETIDTRNLRVMAKSYPATPFTVEMAFMPVIHAAIGTGGSEAGLCIRNSSDGKLQVYGIRAGSANYSTGLNFASPTTTSPTGITGWSSSGANYHFNQDLFWVKYQDDGSNRKISFSADGYSWVEMVSLAVDDYLTPDQIGIFADNAIGSTEAGNGCTFLHWKQS